MHAAGSTLLAAPTVPAPEAGPAGITQMHDDAPILADAVVSRGSRCDAGAAADDAPAPS